MKLPITHTEEQLHRKIAKTLRLGNQPFTYEIRKQSLDARHKEDKKFVYTVDIKVDNESRVLKKVHDKNIMLIAERKYHFPTPGSETLSHRPVVIGSGPAGLFCAWYLAKAGYCPLVLERGEEADKRQETVENFWKNGILDPDSNVQFGEGGAGTFSDGKLNTLVKDNYGRGKEVLSRFVEAGAPSEILYQQKPHLGTDQLVGIVQFMRHQIEEMGGEFRFRSTVTDLVVRDQKLAAVIVNEKEEIPAEICVLAPGHSARDTFAMLYEKNFPMASKPFAVGFRVEHPQSLINRSQYGAEHVKELGAAAYKVTAKTSCGRGVYSFCMCPGGYVVNASSEHERLAVNGMSYSGRDGKNANSAIIVAVTPADYGSDHPLAGIEFQRRLEQRAYELCDGKLPVQRYGDFREKVTGEPRKIQKGSEDGSWDSLEPQCKGAFAWADLTGILPVECNQAFVEGMDSFDRQISGFASPSVILTGVESRTSSPVRIERDENLQSGIRGCYPCGEGAGYAGGITSAAMDGIRVAEQIASQFAPLQR